MKHQSESAAKQKERHIVTWTQQEDDILREQININGTDNWAIIANKFKDKTTRQCRRRWYTYLNSDFKKGGWSPEEDMILCEAQKIFGNRWTEIAKVVSGRTDNAVKNRFTTLCKKRAKHETILKENKSLCTNSNNKRVLFQSGIVTEGTSESSAPLKKMRTSISDVTGNCNREGRLLGECRSAEGQQLRPPFAVIFPKSHGVDDLPTQQVVSNTSSITSNDVGKSNDQATFLKRNDPRITVLMQQAELLSSLAAKVNSEDNNQNLDSAWKELQDFLNRNQKSNQQQNELSDTDFHLEDLKELIEDLRSNTFGGHQYWRQRDLDKESPASSGNSTESTLQSHSAGDKTELPHGEVCSLYQATSFELESITLVDSDGAGGEEGLHTRVANVVPEKNVDAGGLEEFHTETIVTQVEHLPSTAEPKGTVQLVPALPSVEFSSPIKVTPLFRSFGAAIPTPLFSESERNFLMKTFGSASSPPNPNSNHSQPPPCKRSLLQSL